MGLNGGDRKSEFQIGNSGRLPDADPGKRIIHRWSKKLCKVEKNGDGKRDGFRIGNPSFPMPRAVVIRFETVYSVIHRVIDRVIKRL